MTAPHPVARFRRARRNVCAHALLAAIALLPASSLSGQTGESWVSRGGYFRVAAVSRVEPVPVNRMHAWVLTVTTADGLPVADASIEVAGRMPAHGHGLPTAPAVTGYLGDGRYLLQGLRFHMHGDWELSITITAGATHDTVVIPFRL